MTQLPVPATEETFERLPFSPLAGEMPKAEGGSAVQEPYLVIIHRPPSVTP